MLIDNSRIIKNENRLHGVKRGAEDLVSGRLPVGRHEISTSNIGKRRLEC